MRPSANSREVVKINIFLFIKRRWQEDDERRNDDEDGRAWTKADVSKKHSKTLFSSEGPIRIGGVPTLGVVLKDKTPAKFVGQVLGGFVVKVLVPKNIRCFFGA